MPSDKRGAGEKERTEVGEPPEEMDFSPSSGATDPEHAEQDVSEDMKRERHGYTENQTYIGGEIKAKSDRWENLNQANQDFYANEEKQLRQEKRETDYKNDAELWGQRIELTNTEIKRVVHIIELTDQQLRRRHGIETIILAAITLAANEGIEDSNTSPKAIRPHIEVPEDSPIEQTPIMSQTYQRIRNDMGLTRDDIRNAREELRKLM